MFLLDTGVISEGRRPLPDSSVDAWFASQNQDNLFLSAVSIGELWYGVEQLPMGRRRKDLEQWFAATVTIGFAGRILAFDNASAMQWGDLRAKHREAKTVDSQIAATALVHGLTLVTRNVKDFAFQGLSVFDPWRS